MHAYCLFCETQKCKTIAQHIERTYNICCISPEIIQRKWTKGIPEEKHHDWLPGYIFLYSEELIERLPRIPGIIRLLGNSELQGTDLAFANMLRERHGTIGILQIDEINQFYTISDLLWQQMEGQIIKIDRERKRCCVEFSFDNKKRTVWVGYDIKKTL